MLPADGWDGCAILIALQRSYTKVALVAYMRRKSTWNFLLRHVPNPRSMIMRHARKRRKLLNLVLPNGTTGRVKRL